MTEEEDEPEVEFKELAISPTPGPAARFDNSGVVATVEELETTLQRKLREAQKTISHPLLNPGDPWPRYVDQDCYFCTAHLGKPKDPNSPYHGPPIPLPTRRLGGKYCCSYLFCSVSCARAYAIETHTLNHCQILLYLTDLAQGVFGIRDETERPSLPRCRLKRFGGDLSDAEYQANLQYSVVQRVEDPLFLYESPTVVEIGPDYRAGVSISDVNAAADDEKQRLANLARAILSDDRKVADVNVQSSGVGPNGEVLAAKDNVFTRVIAALSASDNDGKKAHAAMIAEAKKVAKVGAGGVRAAKRAAEGGKKKKKKPIAAQGTKRSRSVKGIIAAPGGKKKRKTVRFQN